LPGADKSGKLRVSVAQLTTSDSLSKFQITKLIDDGLSERDLQELEDAEDLAKRFMRWDLGASDGTGVLADLRELLGDMELDVESEAEAEIGMGSGTTFLEHRLSTTRSELSSVRAEALVNDENAGFPMDAALD
jgi:hypothetical protein